jgi:hypothetical protein
MLNANLAPKLAPARLIVSVGVFCAVMIFFVTLSFLANYGPVNFGTQQDIIQQCIGLFCITITEI